MGTAHKYQIKIVAYSATQRMAQFEADGKTISYDVLDAWLASWGTDSEGQCSID